MDELLELVQQGFPLALVGLDVLLPEELIDVRIAPHADVPVLTAVSSMRAAALPYRPLPHTHRPRSCLALRAAKKAARFASAAPCRWSPAHEVVRGVVCPSVALLSLSKQFVSRPDVSPVT
jgi:hypothetical protein